MFFLITMNEKSIFPIIFSIFYLFYIKFLMIVRSIRTSFKALWNSSIPRSLAIRVPNACQTWFLKFFSQDLFNNILELSQDFKTDENWTDNVFVLCRKRWQRNSSGRQSPRPVFSTTRSTWPRAHNRASRSRPNRAWVHPNRWSVLRVRLINWWTACDHQPLRMSFCPYRWMTWIYFVPSQIRRMWTVPSPSIAVYSTASWSG